MEILSWNIRGLNSLRKQRLLKKKVKIENLDIIFLQETKCSNKKMKEVCRKFGRRMELLEVEGNGSEGGLATLWKPQSLQLISVEATRFFVSI